MLQPPQKGDPQEPLLVRTPERGNTLFKEPFRIPQVRASVETLWDISRVLTNAAPLPGPFPELSPAPVRSARLRLERRFPSLTDIPNPQTPSRSACPGGFSEQRRRAAALTFSSSWVHRREGSSAAAAVRLLCDRSERTVKMDARPRRCHYAQSPPPLRTALALPQSPRKRPFLGGNPSP
ncbi:hypothetical protein P7K49_036413 [Saguinus oedipus]|uniref:Uncharacterized protein n=1 Tax=Saguinus oedipus TaxID=9490 RepID=A0ABQ9TK11_SAGOE|nr:hypothetical protein P7K49_036413 [Saguinus oedipus]